MVIIDSHAIIRNNAERSCIFFIQFFSIVTFYVTKVKSRKQDIKFDILYQPYLDFTSFTFIKFHAILSNVYICEITTTILIQNSSITRFFVLFSYSQSQLLFSPYQTPAIITNLFSTLIILSLQECCVNKNHTVCNILRVNLFSLRSLFLKLESIRCEIVCLFVCLFKTIYKPPTTCQIPFKILKI